ncbi:hypothetical protein GGS23DRAFT_608915, partial [Durotheca rogersii]|uniref:uncharacterized protein n=1 Tax=Durotheca rogersii TaxID=419775 RepID=UPI00221EBFC4
GPHRSPGRETSQPGKPYLPTTHGPATAPGDAMAQETRSQQGHGGEPAPGSASRAPSDARSTEDVSPRPRAPSSARLSDSDAAPALRPKHSRKEWLWRARAVVFADPVWAGQAADLAPPPPPFRARLRSAARDALAALRPRKSGKSARPGRGAGIAAAPPPTRQRPVAYAPRLRSIGAGAEEAGGRAAGSGRATARRSGRSGKTTCAAGEGASWVGCRRGW